MSGSAAVDSHLDRYNPQPPLVSVIIPSYNGMHLLDTCLSSLERQTHARLEVVLVDNGSADNTVAFVREHYPYVRVVENGRNLGFGSAVNIGIRASEGEFAFVLNNDTEVDPACVERLVAVAVSDSSVGMCATMILDFAKRDIIDVAGIAIYPDCSSRGRGRLDTYRGQFPEMEEVFGPSGAAGFYRRAMLDEVGLFDDDFFMYCEDTDLAFRARLAGWRCLFVREAVVYHIYSATAGMYSPMKAFYVERNRAWMAVKVLPAPALAISFAFTVIRYAHQATATLEGAGASGKFAAEGSKLELVWLLARAHAAAIRGLPAVLRKRRRVQALRRVSAAEIRGWFRLFAITARELAFTN